ncbi:MAG: translation initiation factor [Mariprofundaceae bacterium]|nr:translation initiation factor [Mariprofundaceae bacterium]
MNNDRRLVYSSEDGQIGKAMPNTQKKRKKTNKSSAQSIKNPAKQGVRIRRESKGRGGKHVCVIEGLSLNPLELKVLHKKLKAQLGTGGAVKDACIEIQGDHRQKLLMLLENEGVEAKLSGG